MASQQWQDYSAQNEEHGDDLSIVGQVSMLEHISMLERAREHFKERFSVKSANIISLVIGYERQRHFFKRQMSVDSFGWHLELDERYGRSVLDKSGMGQEKSAVTPGSKEATATAENAEKKVLGHVQQSCGVRYGTTFATKVVMPRTPRWEACKKSRESRDTSEADRDAC